MRHAVPGLPLISPPPHHDIYSIEDLAQLIYDLRQINPRAKIGVKLVAEAGVGTVAAGVAKARADYILIAGHSGGTGAAPLASIKHAGVPWELGMAETQQTLVMNGLRSRVRLRTDGGLKTPEDIITAAILGADEFGFGTSVLVAIGCDMARQCHLNTCPTGIATQREDLRAKFTGKPEDVIGYFNRLTEALREEMAALGARTIDDLIGRTDLLAPKTVEGRAGLLDLNGFFADPAAPEARRKSIDIDHNAAETLDTRILGRIREDSPRARRSRSSEEIRTEHRTVGARIAGEMTVLRDATPSPLGRVSLRFRGSAGQSFGAFAVPGLSLKLEGEANDYVGKGMSGGEVAIFPDRDAPFTSSQVIAGNTILYGATAGTMFIAGKVGERFAVRNSGATAVVEGVGDHGCEYMTGGQAVILGPTGRNFGAGMTNGVAWVHDPANRFEGRINAGFGDDPAAGRRREPGTSIAGRASRRGDRKCPCPGTARELGGCCLAILASDADGGHGGPAAGRGNRRRGGRLGQATRHISPPQHPTAAPERLWGVAHCLCGVASLTLVRTGVQSRTARIATTEANLLMSIGSAEWSAVTVDLTPVDSVFVCERAEHAIRNPTGRAFGRVNHSVTRSNRRTGETPV